MAKRTHILSKQQAVGAGVLLVLVAAVMTFVHLVPQKPVATTADSTLLSAADSLRIPRYTYRYDTVALCLRPFDPNTADSLTLLQLGLKRWQVSNMLKYRAKGGVYRRAEDLKRLYGMTDSLYRVLLPYIDIDSTHFAVPAEREDSLVLRYPYTKKDTLIELNAADTTALCCLRGIGSGVARQIVRYRTQIGGYASPEQIREIELLQQMDEDSLMVFCFDSVLPHLWATPDSIRPIAVNHTSVRTLQRHPYLRYEQAKALYTLRRNRFRLSSIDELRSLPEFTPADIERLTPYLSFEE